MLLELLYILAAIPALYLLFIIWDLYRAAKMHPKQACSGTSRMIR